jgi:hypothetical protein
MICLHCDQNSYILVACDNTYTMESKDEMYLLTFFFKQYSLSFATSFHMRLVLGN